MPLGVAAHVRIGTAIIGMNYSHVDESLDCMSNYKLTEWKGAFGVRPVVCFEAWVMISKKALKKKLSVTHFYWALYWMRTYQIETDAARNLTTNPKTLREKVREMIRLLSAEMNKVVSENHQHQHCLIQIFV